jgi:hypothetical protein
MFSKKNLLIASGLLLLTFSLTTPAVNAKTSEYDKIVKHLKTNYQAKKVRIPFMWLAKFAVKVVRPAGVKSFNVTLFQDLQFSRETLDLEMRSALANSFGPEWSPIFRVRSRDGQNAYMYLREDGKNVKITVVTVEKNQAAVIRATFSPERLAQFINEPSIFGISLSDSDAQGKKIETGN